MAGGAQVTMMINGMLTIFERGPDPRMRELTMDGAVVPDGVFCLPLYIKINTLSIDAAPSSLHFIAGTASPLMQVRRRHHNTEHVV